MVRAKETIECANAATTDLNEISAETNLPSQSKLPEKPETGTLDEQEPSCIDVESDYEEEVEELVKKVIEAVESAEKELLSWIPDAVVVNVLQVEKGIREEPLLNFSESVLY